MNKCVKIVLTLAAKGEAIYEVVQKHARRLLLEGVGQVHPPNQLKIVACGTKEDIEEFVDALHKEAQKHNIIEIEVEPFLKDRDYRGVFRVIE